MIAVRLTSSQLEYGTAVGIARHSSSRARGQRLQFPEDGDPVARDVAAALAEYAAAIGLGRPWNLADEGRPHSVDVLPDIEVRWTPVPSGRLVIRPRDDEAARWLLVTGTAPDYQLQGWLYGWEAKRDEWLDPSPPAAWWAPQSALHDPAELAKVPA